MLHASATLVGWLELDQAWDRGPRMCCTGAALVGQLVTYLTSKASVLVVHWYWYLDTGPRDSALMVWDVTWASKIPKSARIMTFIASPRGYFL